MHSPDPPPLTPLELSWLAKYKSCQVFCGYAGSLALPGMRRDMKAWCSSSGNYHRHKEEEEEVGIGVWVCSALDGYFMFSFPYEQCSLQLFASISGTHLLFSQPLIFFPSLKEKTCAGYMCAVYRARYEAEYNKEIKRKKNYSHYNQLWQLKPNHPFQHTSSKFISSGLSQGLKNLPVRCFFRGTTTI